MTFARPPRTILVACTRRIGDVLLTTPLVRSLKAKWPEAQIDMIVFRGTEGVLEHNPDIRRVIVVAQRARLRERFADAARIWRRYDLACAAISSDRARFYTWFAGRKRVGVVDPERVTRLARFMLSGIALNQHAYVHTVTSCLALASLVGAEPLADVVAPGIGDDPARRSQFDARFDAPPAVLPRQPLAVLHPSPMYAYKQWTVAGWAELTRWLRAQGFAVALSGGPAAAETEYAQRVVTAAGEPVLNLVGQLSFGETAEMIRRAKLFVGPDTGATHVAAACGTPTIALFGPSNPVRWGPWPSHWPAGNEPWPLRGSGRRGNVYLLQGEGECVPCKLEGCDRHLDSFSECLTQLDARRVIGVAAEMLGLPLAAVSGSAPIGVSLLPRRATSDS
ncbi:glycosyltransferase family 9 protein [Trinickia terrae]|uniref:Glycosyltransferase family 9 protein n=1 Tax=Trinickia terrae TaxID=2571161 RepID=A0A4U1HP99_9BURK|nr:glycosyltransferase family 9 protein [Trinickia terrae]TKC83209.1 glycosyltransferase family 9 protein [Trinickia terrae]